MADHARQMNLYQSHALVHAIQGCSGSLSQSTPAYGIVCPLCLQATSPGAQTRDHAPPSARQTLLGGPHLEVLACERCNGAAGRNFEGDASVLRRTTLLRPGVCPVHALFRETIAGGLFIQGNASALVLAELKAAYLIAFTSLGYGWAMTGRLDRIRRAIRERDPSYAKGEFDFGCLHDVGLSPRTLVHVDWPVPAVIVVGEAIQVALPVHATPLRSLADLFWPRVPHAPAFRQSNFRGHPMNWPPQFAIPGGTPKKAWESGKLFHLDRCDAACHDSLRADPLAMVLRALAA